MELAEKILNRITICKPQKKFLITLFTTILIARGKINFRNLSRYSHYSERTYARQFDKSFNFMAFNRAIINDCIDQDPDQDPDQDQAPARILALDASFIPKSGNKTYGLDYFFNGCHCKTEKGLEICGVALVDVEENTAYPLSVRQTAPIRETENSQQGDGDGDGDGENRIDQYLQHLREITPYLNADETYLCVDGFFSKKKFIDGVTNLNLHQIGRLRYDANMRYLYTGPKREKGSGNQKTYDGKVDWQDLSRFTYHHTQDGIALYSQILNHPCFKRNLKVVVLVNEKIKDKKNYVILFSTDPHLEAQSVVTYYKARFQIEFIFRDAKQFTGLSDAQTRDQKRLDFHFNASLTTLNLSKAEHLKTHSDTPTKPFSMTSIKACYFNTFFLEKFFSMFDLDPKHIKKSPQYKYLINYGNIAA